MPFIIAQICGAIALILTVISIQVKTKDKIIMCTILANIVVTMQYFLLGALTGGVLSIINTIRCIVFYIYKKKNLKPSIIILLIFEIVTIISGCISFQNAWSLIPIVVSVIYTYGLWQDNVTVIRITTGIAGFGWALYNAIVKAYTGVIQETLAVLASIFALYNNRSEKIY